MWDDVLLIFYLTFRNCIIYCQNMYLEDFFFLSLKIILYCFASLVSWMVKDEWRRKFFIKLTKLDIFILVCLIRINSCLSLPLSSRDFFDNLEKGERVVVGPLLLYDQSNSGKHYYKICIYFLIIRKMYLMTGLN